MVELLGGYSEGQTLITYPDLRKYGNSIGAGLSIGEQGGWGFDGFGGSYMGLVADVGFRYKNLTLRGEFYPNIELYTAVLRMRYSVRGYTIGSGSIGGELNLAYSPQIGAVMEVAARACYAPWLVHFCANGGVGIGIDQNWTSPYIGFQFGVSYP